MTEGTVRMRMKALLVAAPLALAVLGPGVPADAQNAAKPTISPGNGQIVTSSNVTISVKSGVLGGKLVVDGTMRDSGANQVLTWSFNGHTHRNGPVRVVLQDPVPFNSVESTFTLAVPASAPSGVQAKVNGNKVTVSWNRGDEPDLTGYAVSTSLGGGKSVGVGACGGRCSTTLNVGSTTGGQLGIQVVAKRRGAQPSGATSRTVRIAGTTPPNSGNGNGNGNGNNPVPPPSNTWPTPNGNNPAPFPSVNPSDPFSTISPAPEPSAPDLSPDGGPDPDTSLIPQPIADARGATAEESLQWGKSIALALVLLLCAGHLGTWTRRLRSARAGGGAIAGPRIVHGSAHARVEANRQHIEAALAAARGSADSDSPPSKRRFLSRKRSSSPEPLLDVPPADDALAADLHAPEDSSEQPALFSPEGESYAEAATAVQPSVDTDDEHAAYRPPWSTPDDETPDDPTPARTSDPDTSEYGTSTDSPYAPAPRDPSAEVDGLAALGLAAPRRSAQDGTDTGTSALRSAYAPSATQTADLEEPAEPWYEGMPDAPYTWSAESSDEPAEPLPTTTSGDPSLGPAELLDTPRRRFGRRRK